MQVIYSDDATDEFDELPVVIKARIVKIAKRLESWPDVSGAKPLRGDLSGSFRIRTGDYRLQFRIIDDEIIYIEKIGHRDGFYED